MVEVVRGWEKLRLYYNLILSLPGLGILWLGSDQISVGEGFIAAILVGLGANIAFLLGPLTEVYLRGLFFQGRSIGRGRLLIFGAGLAISAGFFLLVLIGLLFSGNLLPDQQ